MLLIKNIGQLVTFQGVSKKQGIRPKTEDLSIIENAALLIEKDKIAKNKISWIGKNSETKRFPKNTKALDAEGMVVLPGLIDPHTHLVFAGDRSHDFAMRCEGKSYLDIAKAGGGILSTVQNTQKASPLELFSLSKERIHQALKFGITTIEIKSGYGLTLESEIKTLKVIQKLKKTCPARLISTFLGAHDFPLEYRERRDDYVDLICTIWLPGIAKQKLAEFCDVFIDEGFFDLKQTEKILKTALEYGLKLRIHSDEFTPLGGTELAAKLNAFSADHLMAITDSGIAAMAKSNTVATLLPATSFFLGKSYAPARKLIDAGVRVALGTDFNPGSSMTQNLPLVGTIACTQMKMTIPEVLTAITFNAAKSLGLEKEIGSIEIGKQADLAFFDVPSYEYLVYQFGENFCKKVICSGKPA